MLTSYESIACSECSGQTMRCKPVCDLCVSDRGLFAAPAPICPQCSGPHSLSQCPNWRSRRILAAARWDVDSFEAQFHKLIANRCCLTKRQQGHIMGAFREAFTNPQPLTSGVKTK